MGCRFRNKQAWPPLSAGREERHVVVIAEPDNPIPQGPAPAGPPPAAPSPAPSATDGQGAAEVPAPQTTMAAEPAGGAPPREHPSDEPFRGALAAAGPVEAPAAGPGENAAIASGAEAGVAASAAQPEAGSAAAGSPQKGVAATPAAQAAGTSEEGKLQGKEEAETFEEEEETEEEVPFAPPLELIDETAEEELKFDWYILKVQVNREDAIKEALERRIKREGMERYFKEIIVPTEDVIEFTKTGKRRTVKRKLYPGYLLVNMAVTDESWFLVRETPGIGDFTGSGGKPTPMAPRDVERILRSSRARPEEEGGGVKTAIPFKPGDRVRVKEGYFQNFEGDVHAIDQTHGRVTVMINIFGRATPVEIEHWQIEAV